MTEPPTWPVQELAIYPRESMPKHIKRGRVSVKLVTGKNAIDVQGREKCLQAGISNKDFIAAITCGANISRWVEFHLMENALTKEKEKACNFLLLFLLPSSIWCCYPAEINGKRSLKGYLKITEIPTQVLAGVMARLVQWSMEHI